MNNNARSYEERDISIKDRLVLSPIEKYIYFDKYPWRLILNLFLIVLVTSQVSFKYDIDAAYQREELKVFRYLFIGSNNDETQSQVLNSPSALQANIANVQNIYQNLNQKMFQPYEIDKAIFTLDAQYKVYNGKPNQYQIDMMSNFTVPFNVTDPMSIKAFLNEIAQMTITTSNLVVRTPKTDKHAKYCMNWTIEHNYNVEDFSAVTNTVVPFNSQCNNNEDILGSETASVVISCFVFVIALISFFISFMKINKVNKIFVSLRNNFLSYQQTMEEGAKGRMDAEAANLLEMGGAMNDQNQINEIVKYKSWTDIPISTQMRFFSPWFFFNIIGNFLQVGSSSIIIITFFSPITHREFYFSNVSLGMSAFFTWTQMLQYLLFWKDVTLITTTMAKAGSNTIVFFGLALPVFIGMSLLGNALFWKYTQFATIGIALRTLFAMSGGDIVHETYLNTWDEGWISSIFLTLYMIIFYTAFVNIFVAIIMEGYSRGVSRKAIDNDDPFPTQDSLMKSKDFSHEMFSSPDEKPLVMKETGYDLKGKIEKKITKNLAESDVSPSVKNLLDRLLTYNEVAKSNLADLFKIRSVIDKQEFDKSTKTFLHDMLTNSFSTISEQISYYRLGLKKLATKI